MADAKSNRSERRVTLVRDGQYVWVRPAVPAVVGELYTAVHEVRTEDGRVRALPCPLAWPEKDRAGRWCVQALAGMEPLLAAWLGANGYAVDFAGQRPPAWGKPDGDRLAELGGTPDDAFLSFVAERDRGLIRCGHGVDTARLVAQVALGWRRSRVLVLAARREAAAALHRRLRDLGVAAALYAGKEVQQGYKRVVVATPVYARVGAVAVEHRTVCVALDPAALLSARDLGGPFDAIRRLWAARLYGVVPADFAPAPYLRDWVTALFGPEQVHVPAHGRVPRRVEVAFETIEGGPRVESLDRIRLLRSGVWQHPVRNRRLCRLAEAVAGGDFAAARAEFSVLDDVRLRRPVVLLAANAEHAFVISDRLSGVPVVRGPAFFAGGLGTGDAGRLTAPSPEGANLLIATPDGLPELASVGVLIRADGWPGIPRLATSVATAPCGSPRGLAVIDCADRHHPALRRSSNARRAAYRAAGWSVSGEAELTLLDRFLAHRPEVHL